MGFILVNAHEGKPNSMRCPFCWFLSGLGLFGTLFISQNRSAPGMNLSFFSKRLSFSGWRPIISQSASIFQRYRCRYFSGDYSTLTLLYQFFQNWLCVVFSAGCLNGFASRGRAVRREYLPTRKLCDADFIGLPWAFVADCGASIAIHFKGSGSIYRSPSSLVWF